MACSSCGGGRVRFDAVPRPTVTIQPNRNVRLNAGKVQPTGAANPNKPPPDRQAPKRTQV